MDRTVSQTCAEDLSCGQDRLATTAAGEELSLSPLMAGMALLLGASVIQRVVGFVRATLFCRWLDPSELGLWDVAFGFLMTATPLAVLALPGSLGRYAEHFRQRGLLGVFLRRTAGANLLLAILGGAAVALLARPLASFIFGDAGLTFLLYYLALALVAVAIFNYVYELALALRLNTWISRIQLANSLLFAVFGLGLLLFWTKVQAIVLAYALACLLTSLWAVVGMKLWQLSGREAASAAPPPHAGIWGRILQYSLWIWVASAITNLFAVADRYMILHWLPSDYGSPLEKLGEYHASRLIPMLLVSLSGLLATMSTPHLSKTWELGDRPGASRQLNLLLKLLAVTLMLASTLVLLAGPILFSTLLAGKYPLGLTILPFTLAACVWFSLFLQLQNYVFCREKAYYAALALAGGLGINILLNVWWLPLWGLPGAVAATMSANAAALGILAGVSRFLGHTWDRGLTVALLLPAALVGGPLFSMLTMAVMAVLIWKTEWILNRQEKQQLLALLHPVLLAGPTSAFVRRNTPVLRSCCRSGQGSGEKSSPAVPAEACGRKTHDLSSGENWPEVPPGLAVFNPFFRRKEHPPLGARRPLRVMFVITCMPVGGAERLLVDIVRRLDRRLFAPELCCLKYFGPLGELLAREIPAFTGLLAHKYDLRVLPRLYRLLRHRRIDAVITVGTGGDKMFWGRLAAFLAGVPVIASGLHSTGLPDRVERLNRLLTPLTDAFIAVSPPHAAYIIRHEGCPALRTWVIPNGVDTDRFAPQLPHPQLRQSLGLQPQHRVVSIIAALRPEKNHELFLQAAAQIASKLPESRFLIVGDGPRREELQTLARRMGLDEVVTFTGNRSDIPEILACTDVVALTSHMEANPLCILEALACGKPVVATAVGSVPLHVKDGETGYLVPPGDAAALADRCLRLLRQPEVARSLGQRGRRHVLKHASLHVTVQGYQRLILTLYARKCGGNLPPLTSPVVSVPSLSDEPLHQHNHA